MRERTRFPAKVLDRLTALRLLVSTGPASAAIDIAAARRHGITVCGTGYVSHPADGVEDRAQTVDRSKTNKLKSNIRTGNRLTGKETP
jgi:hypothetical protein